MFYDHRKKTFFTSHQETKLLRDARNLLFQMEKSAGCRNRKISAAYQHLSILLEQYRYREQCKSLKMGKVRLLLDRLVR